MEKRHEASLAQRIEEVNWKGVTFIQWWELNAWYGVSRISKKVWRDLRERFIDMAEVQDPDLKFLDQGNGFYLINCGLLESISEE